MIVHFEQALEGILVPVVDLEGRTGDVLAGCNAHPLRWVDLDSRKIFVRPPWILVESPGSLFEVTQILGRVAPVDRVDDDDGLRDVSVYRAQVLLDRDERRMDVAGLGILNVVSVDVGVRICFALA